MEIIKANSGKAVCDVPVASIRAEASHRSEIVTQLVHGEFCQVLDGGFDDWCRIRVDYDGYEGWCQRGHLLMFADWEEEVLLRPVLVTNWVIKVIVNNNVMMIPFGSLMEGEGIDGDYIWDPAQAVITAENLRKIAFVFINTAYLWGGKSVFGIDCSGFVQTVFKFFNIRILRDASQQATQGESIGFLEETRCGDLAFFDNAEGKITHVGMLLNDHEIIHASVRVRVDDIDNYGIINRDSGVRTHKLRVIKRYFDLEG